MKIFITGIAGFLGSNLANYYIEKGHEVWGNDNLKGGYIDNVNVKANFFKRDCDDIDFLNRVFKNIDVVVHCAALAHEGLSVFSPSLICKNIIGASVSVFSAAINQKVKRIVNCSSMARYGNIDRPYLETSTPKPVDPYGIAKLAAEKILINLCNTHNTEYNIAIPHNIVGSGQVYNDPFRNVASIMINRILLGKRPIIYGDGNQTRCFSDVRDCIYCLDRMITDPSIKSETINIGPDEENITINQLFEIISNKLGFNEKPIYFPDRPQEVKHSSCSADKSRKLLNYKTKYNVKESIDNMISYIKQRGAREFQYNLDLEIINKNTPQTWSSKII